MKAQAVLNLSTLKVQDVMRSEVSTLSSSDTVESALATFEDQRIGGAPVVDATGKLVGVLTLTDVTRVDRLSSDRVRTERGSFEMSEETDEEFGDETDPNEVFFMKEDYSPKLLGRDLVGDWMARDVISVAPESLVLEACSTMVKHHIHRLFVTRGEKLVGVLSSFDIVRFIAQFDGSPQRKRR
ncbi:MAG: CBS domain-containing protein [Planctomycetes bacterium]|nr:CBS domain-containing protein [Planctomycetota bacterium]